MSDFLLGKYVFQALRWATAALSRASASDFKPMRDDNWLSNFKQHVQFMFVFVVEF